MGKQMKRYDEYDEEERHNTESEGNMSEEEPENLGEEAATQDTFEQEEIKESLEATEKKMMLKTKKQELATQAPAGQVVLKKKTITVPFEGTLKTMRASEMDNVEKSLKDHFVDESGKPWVGQLSKIKCTRVESNFPCTLAVTIVGDKIPAPTQEIVGSSIKAHQLVFPGQKNEKMNFVLFESAVNSSTAPKNEKFERNYAGVSASNCHIKGAKDLGETVLCTEESPVLKWYLENRTSKVGGPTDAKSLKEDPNPIDPLCSWDKRMKGFVMLKPAFESARKRLSDRLQYGKSISFENLAVRINRARVSPDCKENEWVDSEELKNHATSPTAMKNLLEAPRQCYLTFEVEHL